jgi:hypothetical protein
MSGRVEFPFRRVLPLGQLVLCAILLWPARDRIFAQFGIRSNPPAVVRFGGTTMQRYRSWSISTGLDAVAALNLPAGIVQLPYAIFSADHTELMPRGMDFKVWRAVTWPLLGTFFWWIAGRGAEALAASRRKVLVPRIGWTEAVLAFILLGLGIAYIVGFVFFSGPDIHDLALQVVAVAAFLWAFLGGLSVAAKIVQSRLRKRFAADHRFGEIPTTLSAGGPAR